MSEPPAAVPSDLFLYAGEILGAPIMIDAAPGVTATPFEGVLIDETLHLLSIRRDDDGRTLRISKEGLRGTISLQGRALPLSPELLRQRPEDRTKRLLTAGPKRFQ